MFLWGFASFFTSLLSSLVQHLQHFLACWLSKKSQSFTSSSSPTYHRTVFLTSVFYFFKDFFFLLLWKSYFRSNETFSFSSTAVTITYLFTPWNCSIEQQFSSEDKTPATEPNHVSLHIPAHLVSWGTHRLMFSADPNSAGSNSFFTHQAFCCKLLDPLFQKLYRGKTWTDLLPSWCKSQTFCCQCSSQIFLGMEFSPAAFASATLLVQIPLKHVHKKVARRSGCWK